MTCLCCVNFENAYPLSQYGVCRLSGKVTQKVSSCIKSEIKEIVAKKKQRKKALR